jgi:hypothetical protein
MPGENFCTGSWRQLCWYRRHTRTTVPDGSDWLHEVKYDGYRLRLEREGDRVRLIPFKFQLYHHRDGTVRRLRRRDVYERP